MELAVANLVLWIVGGVVLMIFTYMFVTFVPAVVLKGINIRRLRSLAQGKLVLSYDDGPDPLLTPRLLELLARYEAKASFYLLGFRAIRSPAQCSQIAAAGHEIGCHSNLHLFHWRVSPWRAMHDVVAGFRAVREWATTPLAYRPPFGKITTWTWLTAWWHGARVHWWTLDGCDTYEKLPNAEEVVQRFIQAGGGVVLLHSHDRGAERQEYVLAITEQLLMAALALNVEIITMQELLSPRRCHGRPDVQTIREKKVLMKQC